MEDIGELIVGAWLKEIKGCEFVEYGVKTANQGEIDVVGINLMKNEAYLCEAATHIQGIWYADNTETQADRLFHKFERAIEWANDYLADKFPNRMFMLWTPVVNKPNNIVKLDQFNSIEQCKFKLKMKHEIDLEVVCNDVYNSKLTQLRKIAKNKSSNLSSPILRLMQIEEWNQKFINKTSVS